MTLRAIISGTHGVAKSQLSVKLANLYSVELISNVVRDTTDSLQVPEPHRIKFFGIWAEVQLKALENRLLRESKASGDFVSDRCVIDHFAYILIGLINREVEPEVAANAIINGKYSLGLSNFRETIENARDYIKTKPYTHIFYSQPSFMHPPLEDGYRYTNYNHWLAIAHTIRSLLDIFGLKYHVISGDDVQERLEKITEIIEREG